MSDVRHAYERVLEADQHDRLGAAAAAYVVVGVRLVVVSRLVLSIVVCEVVSMRNIYNGIARSRPHGSRFPPQSPRPRHSHVGCQGARCISSSRCRFGGGSFNGFLIRANALNLSMSGGRWRSCRRGGYQSSSTGRRGQSPSLPGQTNHNSIWSSSHHQNGRHCHYQNGSHPSCIGRPRNQRKSHLTNQCGHLRSKTG